MAGHDQFLDVLLHLMRDLRRSYDRQAQAVGLTLSRARALTMLARHEGATQAELAALLDIEPPTLKRQIDALESTLLQRHHAHLFPAKGERLPHGTGAGQEQEIRNRKVPLLQHPK